jgi:predicted MFS family arabinose efflux permease
MSKSRTIAWAMWTIASTFYAYQFIIRVMPNIMLENIMQRFDMDAALFGQFAGVYYIGYCAMHLPIGIMLDRYGPRKVMSICILLTVIGLLPIVFTDYWVYPIIGRALIGMGSSAAILGTFKIIRMTFSEKHFARMLSFSVTIGLIGAIFGGEPVSYMLATLGDKAVVEIFAALGIFLAIVTYFIMPDIEHTPQGSVFSHVKEVLTNKRVIWICLSAGLMVGPFEGFADVWGSEFFKQVYHFDHKVASTLPSMIYMGMCLGAPVLTFIGDKTKDYLGTIIGAGIVMAIGFIALLSADLTPNVITVSFIIVGVSCAYQILAIYKASTYVPDHVVGLTTAVANMIIMSFGYAVHTIIGMVIDWSGGTGVAKAFIYGISIIPVMIAIGVIGFSVLFVQERSKVKV